MAQRALVLHRWDYQETSLILDLFTEDDGRVRVVAKGAKRPKSPWRGLAQPFIPLLAEFQGRSELKTLTLLEPQQTTERLQLQGEKLYSGFYLNELIQRLVPAEGEASELFQSYLSTLHNMTASERVEPALRQFEWHLLQHLGAAFDWYYDADSGQALSNYDWCYFIPDHGFVTQARDDQQRAYLVADIEKLAAWDVDDESRLRQLKYIMRDALSVYLGDKPLRSRELFRGNHPSERS
ncbi:MULTISPECIES: DNA repair protein RecO [Idiomarina]|uniref:DNA repair protein RecO n=1 Tax=Idiomarina TaxID=135575 RepID=UPI000C426EEC|nr:MULTISPECIES: DNA repair protein RecO [Idiomarina]MAB21322.1 DNA repair protein RecO [Idiomarina sp.]MAO68035.1 DNA repair protein RecO [Idiomarina sp.]MBF79787.1 DNA repair protein RecO [Idiomarina sp.]MBH95484.1 DNA repair protein RecO [Idiomarina sp.]HAS15008.1 DNA repair protein RecO [Idiomarina abyssalis]